jgi:cell division protein ZapA
MSRNAANPDSPQAEPHAAKAMPAAGQPARSTDAVPGSLTVDIYDQAYYLRGPDPGYLEQLAALVDAKMRAVAQSGTTVDSLRVAVLAALNIADELVTLRQQRDALAANDVARNLKSRTETLAEMLDAALEGTRKAG